MLNCTGKEFGLTFLAMNCRRAGSGTHNCLFHCAGKQRVWEKIVSVVAHESIVCLIILLGCLSFSSSSTAKMDFLLLQCDPQTVLISLKKHLDQGFGEEKQSSGTGPKEDGQIWKEGRPTKKGSQQNAFNLSAKSVKTDQWTDTTVKAPVCD